MEEASTGMILLVFAINAALFAAIGCGVYRVVRGWFRGGKPMFCSACGNEGPTRSRTPGSIVIEAILYLFLIVPGLIYSFWRISKRTAVCSKCGSESLIPPESPVALSAKSRLNV